MTFCVIINYVLENIICEDVCWGE